MNQPGAHETWIRGGEGFVYYEGRDLKLRRDAMTSDLGQWLSRKCTNDNRKQQPVQLIMMTERGKSKACPLANVKLCDFPGLQPHSPASSEILSCFSCPNVVHFAGIEPVSPGSLATVSDVRAVMEVQEEGMVPVRPVSPEISSRARWVRADHWLGREPVRPASLSIMRVVRAVMADQDGGRDPVTARSETSSTASLARLDQALGSMPPTPMSWLTLR